jgi:hypothetical protein
LLTFLCGRQRKVSAAPHRGNANKPIRKQGKANTVGKKQKAKSATGNHPKAASKAKWQMANGKWQKPKNQTAIAILFLSLRCIK